MSSYTYECKKCGKFTVDRSINDKPDYKCITPGCKLRVIQVFSSPMIKVNCSGFVGTINKN